VSFKWSGRIPAAALGERYAEDKYATTFDLGESVEGSVTRRSSSIRARRYAPLRLDGMLREPNGCFEQTSSTNYPNIMVLSVSQGERRRRIRT